LALGAPPLSLRYCQGSRSAARPKKGDARTVFALNMDCREQRHIADRTTLAQACLRDIDAI
jgi:hypothetical protein